jgi:hypothetical protein
LPGGGTGKSATGVNTHYLRFAEHYERKPVIDRIFPPATGFDPNQQWSLRRSSRPGVGALLPGDHRDAIKATQDIELVVEGSRAVRGLLLRLQFEI